MEHLDEVRGGVVAGPPQRDQLGLDSRRDRNPTCRASSAAAVSTRSRQDQAPAVQAPHRQGSPGRRASSTTSSSGCRSRPRRRARRPAGRTRRRSARRAGRRRLAPRSTPARTPAAAPPPDRSGRARSGRCDGAIAYASAAAPEARLTGRSVIPGDEQLGLDGAVRWDSQLATGDLQPRGLVGRISRGWGGTARWSGFEGPTRACGPVATDEVGEGGSEVTGVLQREQVRGLWEGAVQEAEHVSAFFD